MRSREALEAEVLDGLKSRLMQPKLFDIFCTEWTKHLNAIQMAKSGHLAALRAELARCKKALDQIADAIVNGVPASAVKEKAIKLQNRLEHIEAELAGTQEPVMLMHPNMALEYQRKVRGLTEALNKPEGRAEAVELIRGLVEKIVLVPEGGKLHVEILGDLAGILSLATNEKPCQKPATNTSEIEQLKVVAGVRS